MKGETNSAGFTIVETLLVLGVTSLLFVMVMITLGGKQNKAQFQQSVRDIQTKVQQTINEVSTGYYPDTQDFTCVQGSDVLLGGNMPVIAPAAAGTVGQGKNDQCVFLGKVLQFSVNGTTPEQYNTYSMAGLRSATDWLGVKPTPIDDTGINPVPQINVTTKNFLSYGLEAVSMKYFDGSGPHDTNVVGFLSQVGDLGNSGSYESGAVDLVAVPGLGLGSTESATITTLRNGHLRTAAINPVGGVVICFKSGTTNDTALLSIGSNGHNLAVKLEIKACS
ncbi:MAG: type II secretion system protein [Candidatus Saccharimonadales bacterium]